VSRRLNVMNTQGISTQGISTQGISTRRLARGFVLLWFTLGGLAHFLATQTEARIVPPIFPYPTALVLISGVGELAGAAGLLVRRLRPLAGLFLMALTIAVTPANVWMWDHADLFPSIPPILLLLRLPFQLVLLWLIWWGSRPVR